MPTSNLNLDIEAGGSSEFGRLLDEVREILESIRQRKRIKAHQLVMLMDRVLKPAVSNNIYTILDYVFRYNIVAPDPELGLDEGDEELESIFKLSFRALDESNYPMYDYLMNLYKEKSEDDIKLDSLKWYIKEKKVSKDFITSVAAYYKLSPEQLS